MKIFVRIILVLLLIAPIMLGGAWFMQLGSNGDYREEDGSYRHVSIDSSISHLIEHPAFNGFGQFMEPWASSWLTELANPLALEELMPKVGPWDPGVIVDGVNFLIDKINSGETIFYPIYSEEELIQDESKRNTGLFFLEGKAGAPFAFVIPGGGFTAVATIQEGFPVAKELNAKGYNVFILRYRVAAERSGDTGAFFKSRIAIANSDMAQAFSFIRSHSNQFELDFENYSVWGFSAGGVLAGYWSAADKHGYIAHGFPAPAATIVAYAPFLENVVHKDVPPVYAVAAADDNVIDIGSVDTFAKKLTELGVRMHYKRVENAGHGFGVGINTDADGWINEAEVFWKNQQ